MAHHAQPIAMTAGTELRAPALADSRLRGWSCGARAAAAADAAPQTGKGKERVEEPDPRSPVWRCRRTDVVWNFAKLSDWGISINDVHTRWGLWNRDNSDDMLHDHEYSQRGGGGGLHKQIFCRYHK